MGRFNSPGHAQRLLAAPDQITTLFRPKRHRLCARPFRHARADAFSLWGLYLKSGYLIDRCHSSRATTNQLDNASRTDRRD